MGFKRIFLLCTIGIFSLTGCEKSETATIESTPEFSSTTAQVKPVETKTTQPAQAQSEYPQLLEVVESTKVAVEANDFSKAQQEFEKFEGVWSSVEDGIKEKYSESYDAIEEDMDHVTSALKSSQTEQTLAALQSLNTHIQSIPKT